MREKERGIAKEFTWTDIWTRGIEENVHDDDKDSRKNTDGRDELKK